MIAAGIFFCQKDCFAQDETVPPDSVIRITESELASKEESDPEEYQLKKSPTGAIIRSLVLPGWGQYYVESYWKIPVFLGAAGTLAYIIADNHSKFMDYSDRVDNAPENIEQFELQQLKSRRELYRDNRDMAGLYFIGVYTLGAIDAYVGAHLYDFSVSEDLTLSLKPDYNSLIALQLRISIY